MFEKESKEYARKNTCYYGTDDCYDTDTEKVEQVFKDAAIFGYKRCKEVSNKIIQSLLTIIYTESRTDIYTDEIGDAEKFLEEDYV